MSNSAPASLTSALLARKGHAVPAAFSAPGPFGAGLAHKTTITFLAPAEQPVGPIAPAHPVAANAPEAVPPAFAAEPRPMAEPMSHAEKAFRSRIRMTLRTQPDLHNKVKRSAQHLHRSMNDLITEAVTRYIDQLSLADGEPQP